MSIPLDTGPDTQFSKDQSIELIESQPSVEQKDTHNKKLKHKKISKKVFIEQPKNINLVLKSADERMQEERGMKNLDGYNYDSSAPTNSRHDNYF